MRVEKKFAANHVESVHIQLLGFVNQLYYAFKRDGAVGASRFVLIAIDAIGNAGVVHHQGEHRRRGMAFHHHIGFVVFKHLGLIAVLVHRLRARHYCVRWKGRHAAVCFHCYLLGVVNKAVDKLFHQIGAYT